MRKGSVPGRLQQLRSVDFFSGSFVAIPLSLLICGVQESETATRPFKSMQGNDREQETERKMTKREKRQTQNIRNEWSTHCK